MHFFGCSQWSSLIIIYYIKTNTKWSLGVEEWYLVNHSFQSAIQSAKQQTTGTKYKQMKWNEYNATQNIQTNSIQSIYESNTNALSHWSLHQMPFVLFDSLHSSVICYFISILLFGADCIVQTAKMCCCLKRCEMR